MRQDHHEGHQLANGLADLDLPEVPPVDLGLITGQGLEAEVGLCGLARADRGDDGPEMVLASGIAPLLDHLEQPTGAEGRELVEGLIDERAIRVDHRGALLALRLRDSVLLEHSFDRAAVNAELACDRSDSPLLGVEESEDLRFDILRDHACGTTFHSGVIDRERWSAGSAGSRALMNQREGHPMNPNRTSRGSRLAQKEHRESRVPEPGLEPTAHERSPVGGDELTRRLVEGGSGSEP